MNQRTMRARLVRGFNGRRSFRAGGLPPSRRIVRGTDSGSARASTIGMNVAGVSNSFAAALRTRASRLDGSSIVINFDMTQTLKTLSRRNQADALLSTNNDDAPSSNRTRRGYIGVSRLLAVPLKRFSLIQIDSPRFEFAHIGIPPRKDPEIPVPPFVDRVLMMC